MTYKPTAGLTGRRGLAAVCAAVLLSLPLAACSKPEPPESHPTESTTGSSVSDGPAAPTDTDTPTTAGGTVSPTQPAPTGVPTGPAGPADTQKPDVTVTVTKAPPTATQRPDESAGANTVAEIRQVKGLPRLYVGGKRTEPVCFMPPNHEVSTNSNLDSQMKLAAKHGVDLIIYPYSWSNYDMRRFFNSTLKGVVQTMLTYNKDARLILRMDVCWGLEYMGLPDSEAAYLNGEKSRLPSMASDAWYEKVKEILRAVVENVMSDDFLSKYVIGFEVLGGNTGEWFEYDYWGGNMDTSESNRKGFSRYLTQKYKTDSALRSAWGDSSVTLKGAQLPSCRNLPGIDHDSKQGDRNFLMLGKEDAQTVDYLDYLSLQRADRLGGFCDVIKEASGGSKLAVVYYGYQFETPTASSAHMAMSRLLTYDSVDMLSGPVSYGDRVDGGIGAYMGFTDAVTAAGKMWMDEGDYRSPVYTGNPNPLPFPPTKDLMDEVMRREVAKCMVYNTGVWWLDLFGAGWFNYESFWQKNRNMMNLMNNFYNVQEKSTPDICFILDESALSLVSIAHGYGANGLQTSRVSLYRSGYEFGTYLLEDVINGKVDDAKVYIFLNPWRLSDEETRALEKKIHRPGKTSLFMYGNGMTTPENFKRLTGMGIHSVRGGNMKMNIRDGVNPGVASNSIDANPAYYVDGAGVDTVGTYTGNGGTGKAGLATYTGDGWKTVFYGGTCLNPALLEYVAGIGGVHRFCSSGDTFYVNNQMAVLHATEKGKKTVHFPESCTIYNLETRSYSTGKSVTFDAYRGQTVVLFYGDKAMIRKIVG